VLERVIGVEVDAQEEEAVTSTRANGIGKDFKRMTEDDSGHQSKRRKSS
jgi:hypothetical protein